MAWRPSLPLRGSRYRKIDVTLPHRDEVIDLLTNDEAQRLIDELKMIVSDLYFAMPDMNTSEYIELESIHSKTMRFTVIVGRKGRIRTDRYAISLMAGKSRQLIRMDINCPPHRNPDQELIEGDHIHYYEEGYDESKWARPLPDRFACISEIANKLIEFMVYCNVSNIGDFRIENQEELG